MSHTVAEEATVDDWDLPALPLLLSFNWPSRGSNEKGFLVYSKGQGSLSKATLLQVVTFPKACSVSSAALSCCGGGCYSLLLVLSLLDDALYSVVVVQSVHSAYIQQCSAALPDWLNAVRKLSSVCTETLSLFKPCRVPILHIYSKFEKYEIVNAWM